MRSRRLVVLVFAVLGALAALLPAAASAEVKVASSFGEVGQGAGQMNNPVGGAFAANGDYYVVDQRNHRVDVFGPSGAFLFAFGKNVKVGGGDLCSAGQECQGGEQGAGAGELAVPEGLAIGGGSVFVSDADNNRVSIYTEAGTLVGSFGSAGSEGDEFNEPAGMAVSGGRLYVADSRNDRVEVFDLSGNFKEAFGKGVKVGGGDVCTAAATCQEGVEGEEAGALARPGAVAAGGGQVYVGSSRNHRVDQLTTAGAFVRAFGRAVAPGGADVCTAAPGCQRGSETFDLAALPRPTGIGIAAGGDVYVADNRANRVSKFDSSGGFVHAWGEGVVDGASALQVCTATCRQGIGGTGVGSVNAPLGLAIDSAGHIVVAETQGEGPAELPDPFARIGLFTDLPDPAPGPVGPSTVTVIKPPAPVPAIPAPPSNLAKLGKLTLNPKKGTATLTVSLPDPGKLVLSGKGVKKVTKRAKRAGVVQVPVAATGQAKKKLKESGKVKLAAKLTFTPTGGNARTQSKGLTLKLNLP